MNGSLNMDEVFKALGDSTRVRILETLARNGETCVCRFVEKLAINQPAVSHHLAKLKQAGLVSSRKEGQWIHYSLNIEALKDGPLAFLAKIVELAAGSENTADRNDCRDCEERGS